MKTTNALAHSESAQHTIPTHSINYKNVSRMINKTAHKFSYSFGLPFEDMQAQGNLLFAHAVCKFDFSQKKTRFSTFLHKVLQNGLITYGKSQLHGKFTILDPIESENGEIYDPIEYIPDTKAEREFAITEMYLSLTDNEKELVDLAVMGFASTLAKLKKLAIKRLNFEEEQFEEAIYGIKKMLQEIEE